MKIYVYSKKKIGMKTSTYDLNRVREADPTAVVTSEPLKNSIGYNTEWNTPELSEQQMAAILQEYIKTGRLELPGHIAVTSYNPENGNPTYITFPVDVT